MAEADEMHTIDTIRGPQCFTRCPGEALHPAREPLLVLENIRRTIGGSRRRRLWSGSGPGSVFLPGAPHVHDFLPRVGASRADSAANRRQEQARSSPTLMPISRIRSASLGTVRARTYARSGAGGRVPPINLRGSRFRQKTRPRWSPSPPLERLRPHRK